MRKLLMIGVVAGAIAAVFATSATYDDIGSLRPAGGFNEYWGPTNHLGVAVDVCDSSAVALDARAPYAVTGSAGACDLRWLTFGLSSGIDFDSCPVGFLLFLR